MDDTARPYFLQGNFAPVADEITATDLEVIGQLPRELRGTYLRNGPNPKTGISPAWLFGDGMVHGIRLDGGRALWYRNRYVRTARYEGRTGAGLRGGGSSNTSIMAHAGKLLSFVETAFPMQLDGELNTLGPWDFGGRVDTPFTAHGKVCSRTGELLGFGYQFQQPHLIYYRISPGGEVLERRPIPVEAPGYFHDCLITERYVIFFDAPARMVTDWGSGAWPFQWQEGQPTRIGLVPREGGGETRWCTTAPCFMEHGANAFERDGQIVIDGEHAERHPALSKMHRWEINLETGAVTGRFHDAPHAGLPRIDDRRAGREYRYMYAAEFRPPGPNGMPSGVLMRRFDVETGKSIAHDPGLRYDLWEGIFVPASPHGAEDDGWVLTLRYDRELNRSELIVIDARAFDQPPVATVVLPRRVPYGIHATWLPS